MEMLDCTWDCLGNMRDLPVIDQGSLESKMDLSGCMTEMSDCKRGLLGCKKEMWGCMWGLWENILESWESSWDLLGSKMATLESTMEMSDCTWDCLGSTRDLLESKKGLLENRMAMLGSTMGLSGCMMETSDCRRDLWGCNSAMSGYTKVKSDYNLEMWGCSSARWENMRAMWDCTLRHLLHHHHPATLDCTAERWDCTKARSARQNIVERSWGLMENSLGRATRGPATECKETWRGSLASLAADSTPEKNLATCPTRSAPTARRRRRRESCRCPLPATTLHIPLVDCPPPTASFPESWRPKERPPIRRTCRPRRRPRRRRRPSCLRPCSSESRFRTCTFPCRAEGRRRRCPSSATAP